MQKQKKFSMNLVKNPIAVIDTNVWVSGAFWEKGNPHDVIHLVKTQIVIPAFSYDTFYELERTLNRIAMIVRKIDLAKIALKNAKEFSVFFEPRAERIKSRDPHDDIFLDIAATSHADFLISGDEDLLALKTIESTKIVTPKQFLRARSYREAV